MKTLYPANISLETILLLQKGSSTKLVVVVVVKTLDLCGEDPTHIVYRKHRREWVRVCVV